MKINGYSADMLQQNIADLRQLFPEICCEDKIDFDKLKQILGEYVDDNKERYNFTWNGKGQAIKLSQTPSMGTLRPYPGEEESKDWNATENLYIEGDNLEVLKLLQKSYYGKVKMIYIDPPYNTGKDFIYPDDYSDSIENYKQITGQHDENGNQCTTNAETSGRYHTSWLNMIYPRLRISKTLLDNDGIIFLSIDDNEHSNLKIICDEIFGSSNYVSSLVIENNPKGRKNNAFVSESIEYCLIYAKNKRYIYDSLSKSNAKKFFVGMTNTEDTRKTLRDCYGEFRQSKRQVSGVGKSNALAKDSNPDRRFTIYYKNEDMEKVEFINEYNVSQDKWVLSEKGKSLLQDGYTRYCCMNSIDMKPAIPLYSKDTLQTMFENHSLYFKDDGTIYEKDRDNTQQITSLIANKKYGLDIMTESATIKMEKLFGVKDIFTNSKAIDFIKTVIKLYPADNIIVLDFFSGSATTAHAVMQLNAEDGGNRRFIMVQLPEPCAEKTEAYKAGYQNICEIGKERIRRAGEKIKQEIEAENAQLKTGEDPKKVPDIGFKVFKLDSSNLKKWQPDYDDFNQSLLDSIDNYVDGRTELDVVYEIMLKMGLELTYPLATCTVKDKNIYVIAYGALMICLDHEITTDVAHEMIRLHEEYQPEIWQVVFKDNGFASDSVKTNIKEILKVAGLDEDAFTTI